ncbi:hypothetical protein MMC13_007701 [Lambiella insularis]|nr:hypothetical protein [Lambiella insularis]
MGSSDDSQGSAQDWRIAEYRRTMAETQRDIELSQQQYHVRRRQEQRDKQDERDVQAFDRAIQQRVATQA